MRNLLSDADRDEALAGLPDWRYDPARNGIARDLRFPDFARAFAFMTAVALAAEQVDHHPEWSNVYNRVEVLLTTHDADGVTELDVQLARFMDEVAGS